MFTYPTLWGEKGLLSHVDAGTDFQFLGGGMLKTSKTEPKDPTLATEKQVFSPSQKDVDWANETLRFCIATLQGKIEVSKVNARISTVLHLKELLAERRFWWQVKVLDAWIHRAQRGDFDAV